jgi:hypothetical protein
MALAAARAGGIFQPHDFTPSRKSRFLPGRVFLVRQRQFPIFERPGPVLTSGCGVPAERRIQPMREPA